MMLIYLTKHLEMALAMWNIITGKCIEKIACCILELLVYIFMLNFQVYPEWKTQFFVFVFYSVIMDSEWRTFLFFGLFYNE